MWEAGAAGGTARGAAPPPIDVAAGAVLGSGAGALLAWLGVGLVQLPVLAFSGALFVAGLGARHLRVTEPLANALSLVAVFAILFWMLPRYIDATLVSPVVELAKFISIPVLVGGSLAIGWAKSNPFLRGFLKANAISMLGVLAFLYIHAPVRICNSYLFADQERLGLGFLMTAAGLGLAWAIPLFFPLSEDSRTSKFPMGKTAA